jgi:hypothetical protein
VLAAGLVALVVAVVIVVLSQDDGDDPGNPVDAVRAFYDAVAANDCDAVVALVSDASWSEVGAGTPEEAKAQCESEPPEGLPEGMELDFQPVSQTGDTAIVDLETTYEGESRTTPIGLVRENGQWKIDSNRTGEASG